MLVAGLRAGWELAYAEFLHRFMPALAALAQRRGFSAGEARMLATEFLADASMRLGESARFPLPRSLRAYLVQSFRHRLAMDARGAGRRRRRLTGLLGDVAGGAERVVAECSSEYAIRAARGDTAFDDGAVDHSRGDADRAALVDALLGAVSADERRILGCLAERLPQREIAERLGTSPGAMRNRIMRLRQRLRRLAASWANGRPAADSTPLSRLLRHDGVTSDGGTNGQ
jgi:RNA polymerase sigma factor (sigma-70 family)